MLGFGLSSWSCFGIRAEFEFNGWLGVVISLGLWFILVRGWLKGWVTFSVRVRFEGRFRFRVRARFGRRVV